MYSSLYDSQVNLLEKKSGVLTYSIVNFCNCSCAESSKESVRELEFFFRVRKNIIGRNKVRLKRLPRGRRREWGGLGAWG